MRCPNGESQKKGFTFTITLNIFNNRFYINKCVVRK